MSLEKEVNARHHENLLILFNISDEDSLKFIDLN